LIETVVKQVVGTITQISLSYLSFLQVQLGTVCPYFTELHS